jgi:hypothetical protein
MPPAVKWFHTLTQTVSGVRHHRKMDIQDSNLNLLPDHYRKLSKNSDAVCWQVPCVSSGLYHILVSQVVRWGQTAVFGMV